MDTDDPYPDVPVGADGFDRVLKALAESDAPHSEKAAGLIGLAKREHELAAEDGDSVDDDFLDYARTLDRAWDETIRRLRDDDP